jgi:5-methylcytosine-specific restriction endonuclease McrA
VAPHPSFSMPNRVKISGRSSTITNSFVQSLIPEVTPTESEVLHALGLLEIDPENPTCSYCGDPTTEWDHLRPLVRDKMPTGFISEIGNLVPSCGKCNQSKGNKPWPRARASRAAASQSDRSDTLAPSESGAYSSYPPQEGLIRKRRASQSPGS